MEKNSIILEEVPDSGDALEADRLRVLEEKKARQALAAKKRRRKKLRRRILTLLIVFAILGGATYGILQLFQEEEVETEIWSDFVSRGSINSTVTGSGSTRAVNAKTLTLANGGEVREVYVSAGDHVEVGDLLYEVDSSEAEKALEDAKDRVKSEQKSVLDAKQRIEDANKSVEDARRQLNSHMRKYDDLSFRAPFAGKLLEVEDLNIGDKVSEGQKLGTLVDDRTMELTLYFSYTYENEISVGKTVEVSVPTTMQSIAGTVSEVNKIRRVAPEGSTLFEVVVSVPNPGTLTEGMGATASLAGADGETIDPYEPGTFDYSRSQVLETKAGGEVISVELHNYTDIEAGAVLLQLEDETLKDTEEELESNISSAQNSVSSAEENLYNVEKSLKDAEEGVAKAEKDLESYHATAPIAGSVISCSLVPGETVEANRAAITIADTSVLLVDIQVDSMNIMYVEPGMACDLTMYGSEGEQFFSGTVDTVSMEGKTENGYSYFPATVRVDNAEGLMKPGMPVDYSMLASQSEDCLLVPNQSVKQSALGPCVFVKAETPPEDALDPTQLGLELPEGYSAVAVTVGLSDQTSAEILDGVEEGQEVFVQYMTNSGDSYSSGMGGFAVAVG